MAVYTQKLQLVCDYIQRHLDEDLDVDRLSQIAALSKFHFHRIFAIHIGSNVMKFIQLSRLKRASFQMAFEPDLKIIDIGLQAGFDSPEAFTRAFKRSFDQTPRAFRDKPDWESWHQKFIFTLPKSELKMNVNIVERPAEKIAYLSHLEVQIKFLKLLHVLLLGVKKQGYHLWRSLELMVFRLLTLNRYRLISFGLISRVQLKKLCLKIFTAYKQGKFLRVVMRP